MDNLKSQTLLFCRLWASTGDHVNFCRLPFCPTLLKHVVLSVASTVSGCVEIQYITYSDLTEKCSFLHQGSLASGNLPLLRTCTLYTHANRRSIMIVSQYLMYTSAYLQFAALRMHHHIFDVPVNFFQQVCLLLKESSSTAQ